MISLTVKEKIMDKEQAFQALKKAADGYVDGMVSGDELHSAVVDYTDAVQLKHFTGSAPLTPEQIQRLRDAAGQTTEAINGNGDLIDCAVTLVGMINVLILAD
jgi:hypothetical protein